MILDNINEKIKSIENSFSEEDIKNIAAVEKMILKFIDKKIFDFEDSFSETEFEKHFKILKEKLSALSGINIKSSYKFDVIIELTNKENNTEVSFDVWNSFNNIYKSYHLFYQSKVSITLKKDIENKKDSDYLFENIEFADYQEQYVIGVDASNQVYDNTPQHSDNFDSFDFLEAFDMISKTPSGASVKDLEDMIYLVHDVDSNNQECLKEIIESVFAFNNMPIIEKEVLNTSKSIRNKKK